MNNENSWIVFNNITGKAVAEIYSPEIISKIELIPFYKLMRPSAYLPTLNEKESK